MGKNKMCPFQPDRCDKEECGVYSEYHKECSFWILKDIAIELNEINKSLKGLVKTSAPKE